MKPGPYNQHARECKTCKREPGVEFCKRGADMLNKMIRKEEAGRRARGVPTMEETAKDIVASVQAAINDAPGGPPATSE